MDINKKNRVVLLVAAMFLCGILYLMLGPGGVRVDSSETDVWVAGAGDSGRESASDGRGTTAGLTEPETGKTGTASTGGAVYIYICGAVKKPGVYMFDHDPRIVEVVEQAGGFTKKADPASVNLAGQLTDGAQIVVAGKNASGSSAVTDSGAGTQGDTGDRININTAGLEELTRIPGIGDAKATAIVTYRQENGRFVRIEDIMNISGIKQGTFDRIKDYITV